MPLIAEPDFALAQQTVQSSSRVGRSNLAQRNLAEDTMSTPPEDIGVTGVIGRSFLTHTTLGSTAIRTLSGVDRNNIPDQNFDVVDALADLDRVSDYNSSLAEATSKDHLNKLLNFQDQMQRFESEIVQYSGHGQALDFAVQMIGDPTNLIPLSVGVKGAKFLAGGTKGAISGAVLGAASLGFQESVLQSNMPGRGDEVGLKAAIITGAAFGGVLGGLVGGVSGGIKSIAQANMVNELRGLEGRFIIGADGKTVTFDQNISAALNDLKATTNITDEGIDAATEYASKILSPGPVKSIVIEGLTSPLESIRKFINITYEHSFLLNKTKNLGVAQPTAAETIFKLDSSEIRATSNEVSDLYRSYVQRTKKEGREVLNRTEFDQQVHIAQSAGTEHGIAEVSKAASMWSDKLNFMLSELKRVGYISELPESLTGATGWARRVYSNATIVAERNAGDNSFLDIIASSEMANNVALRKAAVERQKMNMKAALGKKPTKKNKEAAKSEPIPAELTYADALDIAEVKRDHIIGLEGKAVLTDMSEQFVQPGKHIDKLKFLSERTILANDTALEKYLVKESTATNVAAYRQGMAIVRLQDALNAQGYDSIAELKNGIRMEARNNISLGDKTKDWTAIEADQIKKLDEYVDVFLGRYTKGDSSAFRNLRKYNTLIRLGGVVLSSLGDVAMNVYRHGLYDTVFKGYLPFFKQMLTDWPQFKLDTKTSKDLGVAFDLITDRIFRMLDDADTPLGQFAAKSEQHLDTAVDWFGAATGLTFWNNMNRMVAGHLSVSRTLRNLEKGFTNLSKREQSRLLALNIDESMGNKILREFKKYRANNPDAMIPNFKNWDSSIADIFKAATIKEVDATILLPNKGDFSRFSQQSGWTKLLFQFKSFAFAMTNKVTLNTINRADANMLQGIPAILGLATLSYIVKEKIAGREPKLDGMTVFKESISRSGLMGLAFDYANGINPWGASSKYGERNFLEQLGGPSVGTLGDIYSVGTNAAQNLSGQLGLTDQKDFSVTNSKKVRTLIPATGLFYLRKKLDQLFVNSLATNPSEED